MKRTHVTRGSREIATCRKRMARYTQEQRKRLGDIAKTLFARR